MQVMTRKVIPRPPTSWGTWPQVHSLLLNLSKTCSTLEHRQLQPLPSPRQQRTYQALELLFNSSHLSKVSVIFLAATFLQQLEETSQKHPNSQHQASRMQELCTAQMQCLVQVHLSIRPVLHSHQPCQLLRAIAMVRSSRLYGCNFQRQAKSRCPSNLTGSVTSLRSKRTSKPITSLRWQVALLETRSSYICIASLLTRVAMASLKLSLNRD